MLNNFQSNQPSGTRMFVPQLDVVETEKEMSLHLDMPGVTKESISYSIDNNEINMAGQILPRSINSQSKSKPIGSYNRSFTISKSIDRSRIAATKGEGKLIIRLPKI